MRQSPLGQFHFPARLLQKTLINLEFEIAGTPYVEIRKVLADVVDDVSTDVMGNVIAHIKGPKGSPRLMLAGHCDEIGFMVKFIDDQGYLFFAPIGGVDAHLVPGQRVTVHTSGGPVPGVVGKRPIHQIEPKDRDKVIPLKKQFIDIGCSDKEEATSLVSIGDPVTFSVGVERLHLDGVLLVGLQVRYDGLARRIRRCRLSDLHRI